MWQSSHGNAWNHRPTKAFMVCECGNWIWRSRVEIHPFCNHCHQPWMPETFRTGWSSEPWGKAWLWERPSRQVQRKQFFGPSTNSMPSTEDMIKCKAFYKSIGTPYQQQLGKLWRDSPSQSPKRQLHWPKWSPTKSQQSSRQPGPSCAPWAKRSSRFRT